MSIVSDPQPVCPPETDARQRPHEMPQSRQDRRGERCDAARVSAAFDAFAAEFSRSAAAYMESCIRCGKCAEACHFYAVTGEAKYTPMRKLEPFRRHYRRAVGAFARWYRGVGLKLTTTMPLAELAQWQELIFDSCTLCGRCTLICPMGIDIATLVEHARRGMFQAGLVPEELRSAAQPVQRGLAPSGDTVQSLAERCAALVREHALDIPLDKPEAQIVVSLPGLDRAAFSPSVVALARVMKQGGFDWTLYSGVGEAADIGLVSGDARWQTAFALRLIDAAQARRAQVLVLPECGHAYEVLRWRGANLCGRPLPFEVLHVSEFLAGHVGTGRIRLKRLARSVTFQDSCQVSRGGAPWAARGVLHALGVELREMAPAADMNWCCGGGGGVAAIRRAAELRHRVIRMKMRQIEETGAEMVVTGCATCRRSFDDARGRLGRVQEVVSLLELVADNLADRAPSATPAHPSGEG